MKTNFQGVVEAVRAIDTPESRRQLPEFWEVVDLALRSEDYLASFLTAAVDIVSSDPSLAVLFNRKLEQQVLIRALVERVEGKESAA